jgi:hypothetical protein
MSIVHNMQVSFFSKTCAKNISAHIHKQFRYGRTPKILSVFQFLF